MWPTKKQKKKKTGLKQPLVHNRKHFASTPKIWENVTNIIAEIKTAEENILTRPEFVKDHAKCESLNKSADNLIKCTQNGNNKNDDHLQLKSLTNPVNTETVSKCNVSVVM